MVKIREWHSEWTSCPGQYLLNHKLLAASGSQALIIVVEGFIAPNINLSVSVLGEMLFLTIDLMACVGINEKHAWVCSLEYR